MSSVPDDGNADEELDRAGRLAELMMMTAAAARCGESYGDAVTDLLRLTDEAEDLRLTAVRLAIEAASQRTLAATREGMMDVIVEIAKRTEAERDHAQALLEAYDGLVLHSGEVGPSGAGAARVSSPRGRRRPRGR